MITELTGEGFAEIRTMLRHTPTIEDLAAAPALTTLSGDGESAISPATNAAPASEQDAAKPGCPDLDQ